MKYAISHASQSGFTPSPSRLLRFQSVSATEIAVFIDPCTSSTRSRNSALTHPFLSPSPTLTSSSF